MAGKEKTMLHGNVRKARHYKPALQKLQQSIHFV
jgi:hypothetical protein